MDKKSIVVLSGKGGTGKTTVSFALSSILSNKIIIDADVDAANLFLLLKPEIASQSSFYGGKKAAINSDSCIECMLCESLCRFNAIHNLKVDETGCEGCAFCFYACPADSISFTEVKTGNIYNALLRDMSNLLYASLFPGEGSSGKLVTSLKKAAALKEKIVPVEWLITDGPPGIGCPVNSALHGTDMAVIVTEPAKTSIHDMKRLILLLKQIKIRFSVIINKYDINESKSEELIIFLKNNDIPLLGRISFNYGIVSCLREQKEFLEYPALTINEMHHIINNLLNLFTNGNTN